MANPTPKCNVAKLKLYIIKMYGDGRDTAAARIAWVTSLVSPAVVADAATAAGERVSTDSTGGMTLAFAQDNQPVRIIQFAELVDDLLLYTEYTSMTEALAAVPRAPKRVRTDFSNL